MEDEAACLNYRRTPGSAYTNSKSSQTKPKTTTKGPAKSCAVGLPKRSLRSWPGALIRREATAGSWRSAPLVAVPFAKRLYRRGRAAWPWSSPGRTLRPLRCCYRSGWLRCGCLSGVCPADGPFAGELQPTVSWGDKDPGPSAEAAGPLQSASKHRGKPGQRDPLAGTSPSPQTHEDGFYMRVIDSSWIHRCWL